MRFDSRSQARPLLRSARALDMTHPWARLTGRRARRGGERVEGGFWTRWAREMAPADWVVLAYNVLLFGLALQGSGPDWLTCVGRTALSAGLVTLVFVGYRSGSWGAGFWPGLAYRLALYGSLQLSYFTLRYLLPTATSARRDEQLYRLDVALFGVEPTVWLDRFVTPATTEWFAFFYFSYFLVLAAHVVPLLFFSRRGRLVAEFALGLLGVYCSSQAVYFLVPGYGPLHHLKDLYQHALPSGFWLDTVLRAVAAGGAFLDIFPSLHTGGPLFVALFSIRHRHLMPFRYTWPIALFFSLNIIVATLFLRWHYAVDVLAGIAAASGWLWLAARWTDHEEARRAASPLRTSLWTSLPSPLRSLGLGRS
ncbi:MAG: hypothetical protein EOO75_06365 [Myxococcales bacterium]|nr:MAG: hypothetical protein EOO75_06365 [Myxococcales bacterium]